MVLAALVIGLAIGFALPARARHAPRLHVRSLGPLLVALGAHLLLSQVLPGPVAVTTTVVALVAVCVCAYLNRHIVGMAVLGLGALLNLVGVLANRGISVDPNALVEVGAAEAHELATVDAGSGRHLRDDGDLLPMLGDVVPVKPLGTAVSFGDLIIAMGVADVAASVARRRRKGGVDVDQLTATATADQDWGRAPSGMAVSGSQCSASPDRAAPDRNDPASELAMAASPDRTAAIQSR
jgi:hypothetical protein